MSVAMRRVLTAVGTVVGIVASLLLWLWLDDPTVSITRCAVVVPEVNETLYFRHVAWGSAGGHWQVVLSRSRGLWNGRDYDSETEYIFREPDGLLYKVNGKTLEIHAHWFEAPVPTKFGSRASVAVTTHDFNPDWLALVDMRVELGFEAVPECAEKSP